MVTQSDSLDSSTTSLLDNDSSTETKDRRHSRDSGIEREEEFEILDGESQEIPATPCGTPPEDLSLENRILANFPDGCDRSHTVELKDEDLYVIIPKNLTFAEVTNILNEAISKDDCEELDKIVRKIEGYEGYSITLDNENFKNFCLNQLNLDLQNRSDHQHIYSNTLSQYRFDQIECNYSYSVKELVFLAIAANNKLTEKYQDVFFTEGNLNILSLLVSGQKYVKAFIRKFHCVDGIYDKLKDQSIQLGQSNKIGFFSVIALRKERKLLETVLIEYVLRDLEQVLKTSSPDPLYGVLEIASLIKNEKFITIVLDAFERCIDDQAKKDLLTKSIATILETAISQEHISVIEYLCKRYTSSKGYGIYEQAFADDKVIETLKRQILKNIGARGRREIYDLVLKTALGAGNIAFIEHLCKECAECSNDVINYLDHKLKNNEFDNTYESILVVLFNTGNKDIIVSVLAHIQIYQNVLNSEKVVRQAIRNILENAIEQADDMVIGLLSGSIDQQTSDLQAICKEEFEKALPVVAEQLEKTSQLLVKKPKVGWGTMIPFYGETQEEVFADLTCSEYKKITDTRQSLHIIQSLLKVHANTQQAVDTQRIDRNSTDIHTESPVLNVKGASTVINETSVLNQVMSKESNNQSKNLEPEDSGSQQVEKNVFAQKGKRDTLNSIMASAQELLSNNRKGGEMHSSSQNTKSIKERLSDAILGINFEKVKRLVEQGGDDITQLVLNEALKEARQTEIDKKGKKSKSKLVEIRKFLEAKLSNISVNTDDKKKQVPHQSVEPKSKDVQPDLPSLLPKSSVSGDEPSSSPSNFTKLPESGEGDTDNINGEYVKVSPEDIAKEDPTLKGSGSLQDTQPKTSVPLSSASLNVDDVSTIEEHMVITADIEDSNVRLAGEGDQQNSLPPLSPFDLSPPPSFVDDEVFLIVSKGPLIKDVTDEKEPLLDTVDDDTQDNVGQPNNQNNGNATGAQSTQKSKWPTVVISMLAVAAVLTVSAALVAHFVFQASLLAAGIVAGVGACCLVAAAIIYCCNRPSSSFEGSNIEPIVDEKLAVQQ